MVQWIMISVSAVLGIASLVLTLLNRNPKSFRWIRDRYEHEIERSNQMIKEITWDYERQIRQIRRDLEENNQKKSNFSDSDYRFDDLLRNVKEITTRIEMLSDRNFASERRIRDYIERSVHSLSDLETLEEKMTEILDILSSNKNDAENAIVKSVIDAIGQKIDHIVTQQKNTIENDSDKDNDYLFVKEEYIKNKVDATRKIVYNILHLLRTPLSGINANLSILLTKTGISEDELKNRCDSIKNAVEMIESNMNTLLENGSIESSDNIKNRITKTAKTALLAATKKISVKADSIPDDLILPQSYSDALVLCVLCIVENAAFYSPDNGEITIGYERIDDMHKLSIINVGDPIEPHVGEMIYNEGYSTRENGDGIGLYLTKKTVEEVLNGNIYYENIIDNGQSKVCFTLTFKEIVK